VTIKIKFAGYQGEHSVHTRAANVFCEAVNREIGDSAVVEFEQNITAQGLKAAELLNKTEKGELDGCYFSSSYLCSKVPELALFDQHFLVPDRQQAYAVLDGELGKRLAREVAQRTKFVVLGYWDNGLRHISSGRGPIRQPRDCVGLKIRTLNNQDHQRVFGALGFEPISIDVRDLPAAVRSGRVDAQENPLTNIFNFNLHHTHKHISLTQHLLGVALVLFNQKTYRSWTSSVQLAVRNAIVEATAAQRRYAQEDDTLCANALRADGCELITLSTDERAEFFKATESAVNATRINLNPELIDLLWADLASD